MKKYLTELTVAVRKSLDAIDMIMKGPSTVERGKRMAVVSNFLEIANDRARYFGLGINYRKDKMTRLSGQKEVNHVLIKTKKRDCR